jgi:cell division protein FtsW (lipid II flippase)
MANQTTLQRWSRVGAMAFAWLFAAGVAIQIFLAGLALFDTAERWADHRDFGYMIGILLLPLVVLVLLGRTGRQIIGMTVVLVVLYFAQTALPNIDAGWVAALHPLVAFALLGMSEQLGARLRNLAMAPDRASSRDEGIPGTSIHHG